MHIHTDLRKMEAVSYLMLNINHTIPRKKSHFLPSKHLSFNSSVRREKVLFQLPFSTLKTSTGTACHADYIITVRQQEQSRVNEPNKHTGTRERLERENKREGESHKRL